MVEDDPIEAELRVAARDVTARVVRDVGPAVRRHVRARRRKRHIGMSVATLGVVAAGISVGLTLNQGGKQTQQVIVTSPPSTSPTKTRITPTTASPTTSTPTTTATPPTTTTVPTEPTVGAIPGYSPNQVAAILHACLPVISPSPSRETAVRDIAADSAGLTAVITDSAGWATCNLGTNGSPLGDANLQTYDSRDSWQASQPGEPDAPAHWLTSDVETDQVTSGLTPNAGSAPDAQYLTLVVGRAAPSVTSITLTLPTGTTLTAPVVNGDFLFRELSASIINIGQPDLTGTDAQNHAVYASSETDAQIPRCIRTSTGILLADPPSTSQPNDCTTAPPW